MSHKPVIPSVKKALETSGLEQSKSNPAVWVNPSNGRAVTGDGHYIKENGGWINASNKKSI